MPDRETIRQTLVELLEADTGEKYADLQESVNLREELGLEAQQTVVIGDTMETDILGGVQLGYRTILVLSGGTRREDLARFAYRPDRVVESVAELNPQELAQQFAERAPVGPSGNSKVRHLSPLAETAV